MSGNEAASAPRRVWSWLLWWRINKEELAFQIEQYKTLGWLKSARKISVLCLLLSILLSAVLVYFRLLGTDSYIDSTVMAILAIFIYLGHRWAMIAAMFLWTAEKAILAINGVGGAHPNGGALIQQIIWWCVYMHAFYLAFRVEQQRRKPVPTLAVGDFDATG